MLKKIAACCIVLIGLGSVARADSPGKALTYYEGLMEYYAVYCDTVGLKELEETYMVMYPEKYELDEKDESKKQHDLDDIRSKLNKVIPAIRNGTHEYSILLRGKIGSYDTASKGITCVVVSPQGFVDLSPPERDPNGQEQSIVSLGVLFGKVSKIKLLFINADEYGVMPYPEDKAAAFLKSRTDSHGAINKDIYAVLNIEIIPREKCRSAWDGIVRNIYTPGMEKNYFMIARIQHMDIYDDLEMQHKLGTIGNTNPVLKVQ